MSAPAGSDRRDREDFNRSGKRVLLVSSDDGLRDDVGAWLEAEGHEVMACPGPRHPGNSCVGLRGGPCALEQAAEVCIVDLHPRGAELVDHTGRAALVRHYDPEARPVIVLVDGADSLELEPFAGVTTFDRAVDAGTLLSSLRELA